MRSASSDHSHRPGDPGPGPAHVRSAPGPPRPAPATLLTRAVIPALAALLATASPPASALAQQPARPSAREPAPDSTAVPLTPLTVTVLREPDRAAPVAYAVSEADAARLRLGRTGAFLEEALGDLPGVQVQNRFNYAVGERLAVRGFGSRAQFGVRGVKVLVDGIPATVADGQSTLDHVDLASLGRAEVLRGPGSALYGNAAGGVLILRTEVPREGPPEPEGRLVVGADGLVNASAAVKGWAGSTALSATASRLRYDGFRADPSEDAPSHATYGEADRWTFNGQAVTDAAGGALRVTLNAVDLDAENPGSLPRDALSDDDRPAWGFNVAQRTGKEVRQAQLGGVWDGPAAGGRGELAAWGIVRDVVNPIPPTVIDLSRRAGGVRVLWGSESGVDGGGGTHASWAPPSLTWGAGAEVELQRDDRKNFDNESGRKGALTLDQLERVLATGGFVRAGARPHPRVRLTGALRWDRFRFEADDRYTSDGDDSGSRTMDAWSPTLGLVFQAGPAEVWGNLSTAIETPTTTELVNRPDGGGGFNPRLDPQRSTGAEVGARGRLADGRVRWELALFRTDLEDELVAFESEGGRTYFRNAGASRHEGLEAALEVALGGGVVARAVYSRTDARFETYELEGEDLSGNRVPGLAPNRLDLQVGQERTRFFWSLDGEWTDEVPVDDTNSEAAGAYFLVDARAGLRELRVADAVLSPWAGVRNALDERYTASVTVNAFGGRYYEPGPGRTAYVGLGVRWDPR